MNKTKKITLSGIMIALGTILSFIKIFQLPFGGSITLCSMLPVMIASYAYGTGWGVLSGLVFGVIQALLGATITQAFAGQSVIAVIGIAVLDYLAAYGSMGLAGIFKGKIKNNAAAFSFGVVFSGLVRYFCHILSGWIFFGQYAEWFFSEDSGWISFMTKIFSQESVTGFIEKIFAMPPKVLALIYSAIYNGSFLIPEIIITLIIGAIVISVKPIQKELTKASK